MPLKPSRRAAASMALGEAHEKAQEALLLPDGEGQVEAWREVAQQAGVAYRMAIVAVQEALDPPKRGKR